MRKIKIIILSLILSIYNSSIFAETISENIQVQVILVSPGNQLYSIFGHSAIRFYDNQNNLDVTFNFGTFNPAESGFIIKFLKGTLNYYLSKSPFQNLLLEAYFEKRSVYTHDLNLNYYQKIYLYNYLDSLYEVNYHYKYKFFKDNCATKIRDLISFLYNDSIEINQSNIKCSFRDCLGPYLKSHPFFGNGINILLGSNVDKNTNEYERMFLPDSLSHYILKARYKNKTISDNFIPVFEIKRDKNTVEFIFAYFLLCLIIILFAITYFKLLKNNSIFWEELVLNVLLTLTGLIILLMWGFSEHNEVKNNFNILWANPLSIFLNIINRTKKAYKLTLIVLIFSSLSLYLIYFLGIQKFSPFVLVINTMILIKLFLIFIKIIKH